MRSPPSQPSLSTESEQHAIEQQEEPAGEVKEVEEEKKETVEEVKSRELHYSIAHGVQETITQQPTLLSGGQLKEYQMGGLQWLVSLYNNNLNGILADEMGLGKTVQTIALLCYLMEHKKDNGPFMIIVPLSTMSNWENEFTRWAPSINKVVYNGQQKARQELWKRRVQPRRFNVLLTTYEYIINPFDRSKLSSINWNYIIIDEGHRMKNAQSRLAVTLQTRYTSAHRLILTGTPLQNSLGELWSLLNFLLPSIFNSSDNFEEWFNKPFEAAGVEKSEEQAELDEEEKLLVIDRLHQVLRPFVLRRMKKEVATQLPEKVELVLKCNLSAWQALMYRQIQSKAMKTVDPKTGSVKSSQLKNTVMQLRKVCNHPYLFFDEMGYDWQSHVTSKEIVRSSGKFDLLYRMLPKLQASGHRTLIFFQMTRVMDIFEDFLEWCNLLYLRLDGSTPTEKRSELIAKFNAPDSPYGIFILSTRSGGLGLNLQTADTVIIFDSDWNPQMDLQAQDRAHRIGKQRRGENERREDGCDDGCDVG